MYQPIAIATNIQALQTGPILINDRPKNRTKLVAVWRLDARSQLYCQWVDKDITN